MNGNCKSGCKTIVKSGNVLNRVFSKSLKRLAHPTQFERVTFAFGERLSDCLQPFCLHQVQQRSLSKPLALLITLLAFSRFRDWNRMTYKEVTVFDAELPILSYLSAFQRP